MPVTAVVRAPKIPITTSRNRAAVRKNKWPQHCEGLRKPRASEISLIYQRITPSDGAPDPAKAAAARQNLPRDPGRREGEAQCCRPSNGRPRKSWRTFFATRLTRILQRA
jgi:hypothetical protein